MTRKRYSTTQPTALSSAATNSDTTLYVVDGASFPDPAVGGNGPYTILVGYGTSHEEICTVTAKPGTNILTVTRGEDGSSATAKNIGDVVVHGVSKRDWDDLLPLAGGTMTGAITLAADAAADMQPATRRYVDSARQHNRIINGDFSVNQRGFTSSTTDATVGLDRWWLYCGGGTSTYSAQTPALGDLPESARAFARVVTSGQASAGDRTQLTQRIESVRTLSGKTATVSFWAKAASGTPKVAVELEQMFGTGGSPSANVQTYAGQVTLSTTWSRYSVSVALPSIAGKTLGTGGNDSVILSLWTSAGSTHNSRTGSLGIQSNTFDFWGVQVEEGSVATPYEQKSYAQELAACQRYYWELPCGTIYGYLPGSGMAISSTGVVFVASHPVPMRAIPSATLSGTAVVEEPGVNTWTVTSFSSDSASSSTLTSSLSIAAGSGAMTTSRACRIRVNAGAHAAFSAEL